MNEARFTGRELGDYRLLHHLGSGGAGLVYLAQRLDQPAALFAIKLIEISAQPDPALRATLQLRFNREAEALARLKWPHILPVIDFGEAGDLLYMVMPYMAGGTLAARIAAFPRGMPLSDVSAYLRQLAGALDYAHSQGVIHRDIKPSNILLDVQGQAYLADFGIARLLDGSGSGAAPLTATGQMLGTPQYMAPEQLSGGNVGPAADIYGLGVVLYQLVAGSAPFQADTLIALAMKQTREAPPPLRPRRSDLTAGAEAAILRALAKRPEERYPSAEALAAAFVVGLDAPAQASVASPPPPQAAGSPSATMTAYTPGAPFPAPSALPPTYGTPPAQYGAPPVYANVTLSALAKPRGGNAGWAIAAAITLLAVVLGGIAYGWPALSRGLAASSDGSGGQTATHTPSSAATSSATSATTTPAQWARAIVPAGSLIYETHAAGNCDQQGASWASNGNAAQSCPGDALIMSEPESSGAIGVATLVSMPSTSYPSAYVAQVNVDILGGASTAKFGFKFRQQSVQDSGDGRGGYSFLVDPNGQWQFNRYSASGVRNIVTQRQLSSGIQGKHTLDLAVSGDSYAFYLDGQLIDSEQDSTYQSGFFCLAIEPGATISFRDLALFRTA